MRTAIQKFSFVPHVVHAHANQKVQPSDHQAVPQTIWDLRIDLFFEAVEDVRMHSFTKARVPKTYRGAHNNFAGLLPQCGPHSVACKLEGSSDKQLCM